MEHATAESIHLDTRNKLMLGLFFIVVVIVSCISAYALV